MSWLEQIPKKERRGSRPRCILFMEGDREKVARRLTELVGLPNYVTVSPSDNWMPYGKPVKRGDCSWDKTPAIESKLRRTDGLVPAQIHQQLQCWWLAISRRANTPNWDIASTCCIEGNRGLILIEAKAHEKELDVKGKHLRSDASQNSRKNHEHICEAIAEANRGLQSNIGGDWVMSRDSHYQLSNRFAWSWKLASLGVPVVLIYLGFLNAQDMACDSPIFKSEEDWMCILKNYSKNTVDNTCWEKRWDFAAPFIPIIRSCNQPFDPKKP